MLKIAKKMPEGFEDEFNDFVMLCVKKKLAVFMCVNAYEGTAHATCGSDLDITMNLIRACKQNPLAKTAMESALKYLQAEESKIKSQ